MNSDNTWENDYNRELMRANQARLSGNEGLARVCARRAAGAVIGEFLRRRGVLGVTNSVYDRLTLFNTLQNVSDPWKEVCRHFLLKVNRDHNLPVDADLIHEAIWLREHLLKQEMAGYAHTRNHQ